MYTTLSSNGQDHFLWIIPADPEAKMKVAGCDMDLCHAEEK